MSNMLKEIVENIRNLPGIYDAKLILEKKIYVNMYNNISFSFDIAKHKDRYMLQTGNQMIIAKSIKDVENTIINYIKYISSLTISQAKEVLV